MNALVSLQGGCLGEAFATNIADEGLVVRVAHAVAQQALGVSEGLCANLNNNNNNNQDQCHSCIYNSTSCKENKVAYGSICSNYNFQNNFNCAETLENLSHIMRFR